jgi:hypothetical protein
MGVNPSLISRQVPPEGLTSMVYDRANPNLWSCETTLISSLAVILSKFGLALMTIVLSKIKYAFKKYVLYTERWYPVRL